MTPERLKEIDTVLRLFRPHAETDLAETCGGPYTAYVRDVPELLEECKRYRRALCRLLSMSKRTLAKDGAAAILGALQPSSTLPTEGTVPAMSRDPLFNGIDSYHLPQGVVHRRDAMTAAAPTPGPQMNRQGHLGVIAMEECNEVAQRISKALRFGLDEVQPGQTLTNRERVRLEFLDLVATLDLLADGLTSFSGQDLCAKQAKIERFLTYSTECGTVAEGRVPPSERAEP